MKYTHIFTQRHLLKFGLLFLVSSTYVFSTGANPSLAATRYVSPTGFSNWNNCTSQANPCNVATAMSNATAGDIVLFMDGIYDVTSTCNYQLPSLNPSNSGTDANPIIFKSLNRYGANIRGHGTTCTTQSPYLATMIGAYGKNYITWDGFYLSARNATNTADIFANARFDNAQGCKIINSVFKGGPHSQGGSANNAAIFFQSANNLTIENNIIYEYRETNNNENNAGILGYPSSYLTIKNNEIYNSTNGINLKDAISDVTIQYNYIHDNYKAIYIPNANGRASNRVNIYHNVIANNTRTAIQTTNDAPVNYLVVYNNTIYINSNSTDSADIELKNPGIISAGYPKIYNNIIRRGAKSLQTDGSANMLAECDHNQWSTNINITVHKYQSPATYTSLASWQNSGELDGSRNPGAGSMNSNPLFVNSSGSMNTLADFGLQAGSPCIRAGRNSVNMGADISRVGVFSGGIPAPSLPPTEPESPSTPSGFKTL